MNWDSSSIGVLTTEDIDMQISQNNKVVTVEGRYTLEDMNFVNIPESTSTLLFQTDALNAAQYRLVTGRTYRGNLRA